MSSKIKILYFVDRMLRGGIQSMLINWIEKIDKSKFQIDILLLDDGKDYSKEEQVLRDMKCNVYKLNGVWIRIPTDFIKYKKAIKSFFEQHNDYKVVHLNSTSKNYMVLKYAKKIGVPIRIAHSHSIEFQTKNIFKKMFGNLLKPKLKKYATNFFACSEEAGKWLFGNKVVNSSKFEVIRNAINIDKFRFNEQKRKQIRKQLNIKEDTLIIGNVGRFVELKNHIFLIDIFNEIHKKNSNSKLMLVGSGKDENKIKEKVALLNLNEYVMFLGFKNNPNDYMCAMDIFVFPSKFEGLGLVLIEAQASGLKCYASKDVIPIDAHVSDLLEFISLQKSATEWANSILSLNNERKDVIREIKENGYDINDTVKKLEKIYTNEE